MFEFSIKQCTGGRFDVSLGLNSMKLSLQLQFADKRPIVSILPRLKNGGDDV